MGGDHQSVKDVMTSAPITLPTNALASDAARLMKDQDIGDVLVVDGDNVRGIVTDRDLVVRVIAEGRDAMDTPVGEICSTEIKAVRPDDPVDEAIRVMRMQALRRLRSLRTGSRSAFSRSAIWPWNVTELSPRRHQRGAGQSVIGRA